MLIRDPRVPKFENLSRKLPATEISPIDMCDCFLGVLKSIVFVSYFS